MNSPFVKFPSTPHLAVLGQASVREDKILGTAERQDFLSREVIIEEKIDGANLGISFDSNGEVRAQNRGNYVALPSSGQWKPLDGWLKSRSGQLFDTLTDRYVLFGEWCHATHTVYYNQLPDWFLGFDIYDLKPGKFVCYERRSDLFADMKIEAVPHISRGKFTLAQVEGLLTESNLGSEPAEGLYLRYDQGDWLKGRAKLVRASFVQSIEEHWSRKPLRVNRLDESCPLKSAPNNSI